MDAEVATYMRFLLLVTERTVAIRTPEGRKLATVASVKQARLLIKGYRKAARATA